MNLGMGVMFNALVGDDKTEKVLVRATGREITSLKIDDGARHGDGEIRMELRGLGTLCIWDDGRSCCEYRYMTCDDDLASFVGAVFLGIEEREGQSCQEDWDYHETQFLIVRTSFGEFTVCTHNEHNGYYGGFFVKCELLEEAP